MTSSEPPRATSPPHAHGAADAGRTGGAPPRERPLGAVACARRRAPTAAREESISSARPTVRQHRPYHESDHVLGRNGALEQICQMRQAKADSADTAVTRAPPCVDSHVRHETSPRSRSSSRQPHAGGLVAYEEAPVDELRLVTRVALGNLARTKTLQAASQEPLPSPPSRRCTSPVRTLAAGRTVLARVGTRRGRPPPGILTDTTQTPTVTASWCSPAHSPPRAQAFRRRRCRRLVALEEGAGPGEESGTRSLPQTRVCGAARTSYVGRMAPAANRRSGRRPGRGFALCCFLTALRQRTRTAAALLVLGCRRSMEDWTTSHSAAIPPPVSSEDHTPADPPGRG